MKFFLLVGLGGCIGSILRAGVGQLLIGFGYTTILVNLLGAFMIGFLAKYAEGFSQPDLFKAFWMIGICGGFTTFSAFGIELFDWLENGRWRTGILYAGANVLGTLFFIFLGFRLGTWLNSG